MNKDTFILALIIISIFLILSTLIIVLNTQLKLSYAVTLLEGWEYASQ